MTEEGDIQSEKEHRDAKTSQQNGLRGRGREESECGHGSGNRGGDRDGDGDGDRDGDGNGDGDGDGNRNGNRNGNRDGNRDWSSGAHGDADTTTGSATTSAPRAKSGVPSDAGSAVHDSQIADSGPTPKKEFTPDLSKPPQKDPSAVPIARAPSSYSLAEDEDAKLDESGDLQFRKKDFSKSRTQLFQSVLSSASLKSLKQQFTAPSHPQLHRNPSTVSQNHTKNFQSFIQAPVLLSVTNLRTADIEIGQRLPFDHKNPHEEKMDDSLLDNTMNPNLEDDDYKEETTLQQQRLTLNALKKLSLSLAPIIRSDEDDEEETRQLTTKSLNGSRQESRVDLKEMRRPTDEKRPKPYQPAEVDLSSFSSLTRQSKHMEPEREMKSEIGASKSSTAEHSSERASQVPNAGSDVQYSFGERPHNQRSADLDATIIQNPEKETPKRKNSLIEGGDRENRLKEKEINLKESPLTEDERSRKDAPSQNPLQAVKSPGLKSMGYAKPRTFPRSSMQINTPEAKKPATVKMPDKKLQQINGFRSPMYVPAVLRRTEENEEEGYFDQRFEGESSSTSVKSFDLGYSTELVGSPALKMNAPYTLNKRQYEYILRAAPTRKHWQRDESVVACGNKTCHKKFNFFERRHHCRKCGGIFCKEHTSHYLYINHLAQFTTGGRGTLSKVCDSCIQEYNEFMKHEFGVAVQPPSREALPERSTQRIDYRKEILVARANKDEDKKVGEQLVGSVPANWSWSSF